MQVADGTDVRLGVTRVTWIWALRCLWRWSAVTLAVSALGCCEVTGTRPWQCNSWHVVAGLISLPVRKVHHSSVLVAPAAPKLRNINYRDGTINTVYPLEGPLNKELVMGGCRCK
jgi:hypothetical protein